MKEGKYRDGKMLALTVGSKHFSAIVESLCSVSTGEFFTLCPWLTCIALSTASCCRKMTFGRVSDLGQFIRESEPEPDVKKSKGLLSPSSFASVNV